MLKVQFFASLIEKLIKLITPLVGCAKFVLNLSQSTTDKGLVVLWSNTVQKAQSSKPGTSSHSPAHRYMVPHMVKSTHYTQDIQQLNQHLQSLGYHTASQSSDLGWKSTLVMAHGQVYLPPPCLCLAKILN